MTLLPPPPILTQSWALDMPMSALCGQAYATTGWWMRGCGRHSLEGKRRTMGGKLSVLVAARCEPGDCDAVTFEPAKRTPHVAMHTQADSRRGRGGGARRFAVLPGPAGPFGVREHHRKPAARRGFPAWQPLHDGGYRVGRWDGVPLLRRQ